MFRAAIIVGIKNRKAGIFLAIYLLVIYFYFAWPFVFNGPIEFNPEIWRDGGNLNFGSKEFPRLRMADGLIESGILLEKTTSEIESLLGPQTKTEYFRKQYNLVYWLGPERSFISIDGEWLVIKLNEVGISTMARIVSD